MAEQEIRGERPEVASLPPSSPSTSPPPSPPGAPSPAGAHLQLRPPAHLVSPRARWLWLVEGLLTLVPLAAAQVFFWVRVPTHPSWQAGIAVASALLGTAYLVVMPQWRYRVHRWEVSDDAVYTQTGWLNQERRIAPISRIQTVDLVRGPVAQLLRLASVRVTTASAAGPLRIHGLADSVAVGLVERLTALAVADEGDAT